MIDPEKGRYPSHLEPFLGIYLVGPGKKDMVLSLELFQDEFRAFQKSMETAHCCNRGITAIHRAERRDGEKGGSLSLWIHILLALQPSRYYKLRNPHPLYYFKLMFLVLLSPITNRLMTNRH